MPATGEVAPERMLVTVRAMVPVAGMPPKYGTTKLAMPCAISSWLGLCRGRPESWSATRAHSSDSTAPSNASVSVGATSRRTVAHEKSGNANVGRLGAMAPKRWPMVSTGKASAQASSVSVTSATTGPGTRAVTAMACRPLGSTATRCNTVDSERINRGQNHKPSTQAKPKATA